MIKADTEDKARAEFETLIFDYGFEAKNEAVFQIIWHDYILAQSAHISNRAIKLIELIKFIRKSDNQHIELRTYSQCVEIPNLVACDIEKHLNILLNDFISGRYENEGVPYRETGEAPIGYIEPFSDEELDIIIQKERRGQALRNIYQPRDKYKVEGKTEQFKNPHYGEIFVRWYDAFADLGLIDKETDANGRRIRKDARRLYQFFYDCMAVIGKFKPLGDTDNDSKYDKVRACIKSYNVR